MATAIPRLGQRSVLNSSLSGEITSKTLTTNSVYSNQYYSPQGTDIVFYTSDYGRNPDGKLEQLRMDTSGNFSYAGAEIIQDISRNPINVRMTTDCYTKINDLFIEVFPSSFINYSTGVKVEVTYNNWGSMNVSVVGDLLCGIRSTLGTGYYCVGQFIKRNQASPNDQYFDTSINQLTVSNGTVTVSSFVTAVGVKPYTLAFRFIPSFTNVALASIHIKLISATTSQITSITVQPNK